MVEPITMRAVTARDWPDVVAQFADLGFEQTSAYAEPAAARVGASVVYLVMESAGQAVAAAALRVKRIPGLGRGIAWCPGGPLTLRRATTVPVAADLGAVLHAMRRHVVETQGHVLRLRLPALAGHDLSKVTQIAAAAGFSPARQAADFRTILVDLDHSEEALMAALHGKWRNPLRNALKSGIGLDEGSYSDLYDRFRVLYDEVQSTKGFAPAIAPEFYLNVAGADFDHRILIASKDGQDLGAITVGLAGQGAVYLFGATAEAGRRLSAGYYLTWQGYLMAQARGIKTYDLGGIDPDSNPTVTRFKRRAGGREVFCTPWQAAPGDLAGRMILKLEALRRKTRGQS